MTTTEQKIEALPEGEKCLRFSNGIFAIEIYGPTAEARHARMLEVLDGKCRSIAGEIEVDATSLTARLKAMREALDLADEVIKSLYPAVDYSGVVVQWEAGDRRWTRTRIAKYRKAREALASEERKS